MESRNNDIGINFMNHSQSSNHLTFINKGYKPSNSHKWGPGVRDIYALHYITRGKGVLETRYGTYQLKTGDSFIIFPHMEIYYYPDSQDPWEYVWVEFNGDEVMQLLSWTMLSPKKPVVPVCEINLRPFYEIEDNVNDRPYKTIRSDAKLRLLLSYYMEYYPNDMVTDQTDYVGMAKNYIHNNYWKNAMKVSDIVDIVKVDRSYLFRLFKEDTGMSISAYLTKYRIQRACELLKTSDLSIKTVAYSVGYRDQLYFSKIFKKATSYAPSEYMMLPQDNPEDHRNKTHIPESL
ncbi:MULTISPECIES: AraC family transcriptional regulator [Bacillaceae]|uniref:AraC family ligand binding domain-containing protein n=1 Tax=Evansella alkalicola TaxID=745819 RepID=A0ABS6JYL1_9BACI|nr:MULTISPECIES: helix-turn-helix domain-containing protein [Bacillaceae]MBU9723475.1 AraC family ligand binding domain-containing protein [Bacillus alkalicola]